MGEVKKNPTVEDIKSCQSALREIILVILLDVPIEKAINLLKGFVRKNAIANNLNSDTKKILNRLYAIRNESLEEYITGAVDSIVSAIEKVQANKALKTWKEYLEYQTNEAIGGVWDSLCGTYNMVAHPIKFVLNTTYAISHPIKTVSGLVNYAWNHPVRFVASNYTGSITSKTIAFTTSKIGGWLQNYQSLLKQVREAGEKLGEAGIELADINSKLDKTKEIIKKNNAYIKYGCRLQEKNLLLRKARIDDAVNFGNILYERQRLLLEQLPKVEDKLLVAFQNSERILDEANRVRENTINKSCLAAVPISLEDPVINYYEAMVQSALETYTSKYMSTHNLPTSNHVFTLFKNVMYSNVSLGNNTVASNVGNNIFTIKVLGL